MLPATITWPALPYAAWTPTREVLHRWMQILGKIQLALTPLTNHWWNVGLHITPRGVATSRIPYGDLSFDMELDVAAEELRIRQEDGTTSWLALESKTIAAFYERVLGTLRMLGIECAINPVPAEIADRTPLDRDPRPGTYDRDRLRAYFHALAHARDLLAELHTDFVGKTSPVLYWWGHIDLALTRYSGREAPFDTEDPIEREAYSHELISMGWWAGDERFPRPAFYAYAYPEPPGFATAKLPLPSAYYEPTLRGFYLDYDAVREEPDADQRVREFFQTVYAAAAGLGCWNRGALERRKVA